MCGFIHSTFTTVPVNVIGLLLSNSADTAWWASAGAAMASKPKPRAKAPTRFRVIDDLQLIPIIEMQGKLLMPTFVKSRYQETDCRRGLRSCERIGEVRRGHVVAGFSPRYFPTSSTRALARDDMGECDMGQFIHTFYDRTLFAESMVVPTCQM